jgi:hypothetical protein
LTFSCKKESNFSTQVRFRFHWGCHCHVGQWTSTIFSGISRKKYKRKKAISVFKYDLDFTEAAIVTLVNELVLTSQEFLEKTELFFPCTGRRHRLKRIRVQPNL